MLLPNRPPPVLPVPNRLVAGCCCCWAGCVPNTVQFQALDEDRILTRPLTTAGLLCCTWLLLLLLLTKQSPSSAKKVPRLCTLWLLTLRLLLTKGTKCTRCLCRLSKYRWFRGIISTW